MSAPADVRIELRSDPQYLAGARELISAVAKRLGFDDLTCCQIALAVDEALANVICHGYERRDDGRIWISLFPARGQEPVLRVVIEDEAKQVELEQIKGRALADVRPGGLGVHIIKHVMDVVSYEKREDAGMRLTLEKVGNVKPEDKACGDVCDSGCEGGSS